jgi:hypothetical protein
MGAAVKRSHLGRINIIAIGGLIGLVIVLAAGGFYIFGRQSPEAAVQSFLVALADRDVDRLMEVTYLDRPTKPLREQWEFCLNVAAKDMPFAWTIGNTQQLDSDRAVVEVFMVEFSVGGAKESDEPFRIPVVRRNGQWRVDLLGVPRTFFPGLPR